MIKYEKYPAALRMILISILFSDLAPKQARASDWPATQDGSAHSLRSPDLGIIGSVESFAELSINGRTGQGFATLWSGDLIQVSPDSGARALLDSVGEVLMKRGTIVRLSTTLAARNDHMDGRALVASLIRGEIVVKLLRGAVAYIETDDTAIRASGEGSFRVGPGETQTMATVIDGAVEIQANIRRRLKLSLSGSIPVGKVGPHNTIKSRTGDTTQLRFKLTGTKIVRRASLREVRFIPAAEQGFDQVSPDEEPVPNRLINFKIINSAINIGNFTADFAKTDSNGEATVTFIASDNAGSGNIVASVEINPAEEEPAEWFGTITVVKSALITRNRVYISALALTVTAILTWKRNKPLKKEGPPIPVP